MPEQGAHGVLEPVVALISPLACGDFDRLHKQLDEVFDNRFVGTALVGFVGEEIEPLAGCIRRENNQIAFSVFAADQIDVFGGRVVFSDKKQATKSSAQKATNGVLIWA